MNSTSEIESESVEASVSLAPLGLKHPVTLKLKGMVKRYDLAPLNALLNALQAPSI